MLAEDAAPLGAHFSTAGWHCRARLRAASPGRSHRLTRCWEAARGWARLIERRSQTAVSASLLRASPRSGGPLQALDADVTASAPRLLSRLSGRLVNGKPYSPDLAIRSECR
jgi:hypothetical protein